MAWLNEWLGGVDAGDTSGELYDAEQGPPSSAFEERDEQRNEQREALKSRDD